MIKILAIDDINDNLISLKAILKDLFADAVVLTAQSGPEGIELAIAENPDVILLDIVMPGMDGFEVCQQLKTNEQVRDIPVVFLTALKRDKEYRIKALEYGAEGFLSKPIDEIELTAQIRAMVKIKRANEERNNEQSNLTSLVSERTKELRESHEMLSKLTEQVPGVVYQYRLYKNGASCFPYSSPGMVEIYGVTSDEVREDASPVFGRLHPDDFDYIVSSIQESADKLSLYHSEFRVILPEIGVRWRMCDSKPERLEDDSTLWYGIITDITERKNAEEALLHSMELNKSLLQTIPFGMDIVDEEGNILFLSENLKTLVGQNVIGKKCWDFYRDDRTQCSECPLLQGINIGSTSFYESSGVLGDKTFLISHTGMMFRGKKAMLEIFQDITEKKEVEKKVKLLAHALESISECVSITDKDDLIIYVNNSFTDTYGYTVQELIGKHTSLLRPPDIEYAHVRDILPMTIEGGCKGEIMNRKKDGTLFPISLSTSVIKDNKNEPIALMGVASDITEMRKSRDELIFAMEKAEESNHLKTAFLNNMSHEIRTPMNHIMGFSSLMAEVECKEKDEFADIILNSSNQLLSLIENVIYLSRLQSEKVEIINQSFVPENLIVHLKEMFNSECLKKNLELNLDIPQKAHGLTIRSDADKIRQIMVNLTSNAVKYTETGSINIGFEIVETRHALSLLRFFVKDTGLGIPVKEQSRIFDSFYRTEQAVSMVIGGTGLGLSIVRELARSMDGTIEFESSPGTGSTFYFTFPLVTTTSSIIQEKPAPVHHQKLKDMVLLIADDEQINFLYLEILLKKLVKRIDHASNGSEAIDMVSKHKYDMIFMDLKMPEMNGFEATRKIKLIHPDIPVIAQTAYASVEDREMALLAGCEDFIAKPIKKNLLLEVIQKYC